MTYMHMQKISQPHRTLGCGVILRQAPMGQWVNGKGEVAIMFRALFGVEAADAAQRASRELTAAQRTIELSWGAPQPPPKRLRCGNECGVQNSNAAAALAAAAASDVESTTEVCL
eukprot:SAG11_NODE_1010_length_6199_cov_2.572131_7_plen_115_part_00